MARQLADLCICLGQLPNIRYHVNSQACKELGLAVEEEIDKKLRLLPDVNLAAVRPTFVILDRSTDLGTAIAHNVGYEAMLKDFYGIGPEGTVSYKAKDNADIIQDKETVLNEEDKIWGTLKHLEIDVAYETLKQSFEEFRKENRDLEAARQNQLTDVKHCLLYTSDAADE